MVTSRKEESMSYDDLNLFDSVGDFLSNQNVSPEKTTQVTNNERIFVDPNLIEENEDPDVDLTGIKPVAEDSAEGEDEGNEGLAGNEESSLFTPYAKFLVDEGVFSTLNLEEFDGTSEGLKKAMNDELAYHIEQYKQTIPNEVKRLLDGYEAGVPFDEMLKITSDRIKYDNINPSTLSENSDLQKKLVKEYLDKTTRLPETVKVKMIDQWEDGLELEEQSKLALGELKSFQDAQEKEAIKREEELQKQEERKAQETLTNLNKHIINLEEIVPGIKLNQMMKDKIKNNLTIPVEFNDYGYPVNKLGKYMSQNPIEGEVILNYLFEVTKEFKDWSLFSKAGKSQAIKELEAAASVIDNKPKGGSIQRDNGKSTSSKKDLFQGISGFLGS